MDSKATAGSAWSLTFAAVLDLVALIFLVAAKAEFGLLVGFAACEVILIFAAVAAWKKYFEELIDQKTKGP